jgi:hypothetical protein
VRGKAALVLVVVMLAAFAVEVRAMSPADSTREETPARFFYFALRTMHLRNLDRPIEDNRLLGLSWGRVYIGTLVNSFGDRSYLAGLQGTFAQRNSRFVTAAVGYRVGLMTGYDERLFPLAGKSPVVPLIQPLVTVDARRVGVELSYSGVVASGGLRMRF